jgi:UDP-GlcNAc:undecaprenyl-phosphate/decaprenyl-phosphate GlcNAc-1-phosphate transferase
VHALPLLVSLLVALAIAPGTLRLLAQAGELRPNYRGRRLPFPFGVLTVAAALLALVPLLLLEGLGEVRLVHPELLLVALYALGVALLGLLDDLLGGERADGTIVRGLRGHGGALLRGELSTGQLKAAGALGLALLAMSFAKLSTGRWLLAAGVLVLAVDVLNLLDLRPGRSTKAFVLIGAGLTIGSMQLRPLLSLGLFAGPALVAGAYDLRERAMLGDTGACVLGALTGLWLVSTLSTAGQIAALAALALIALYGELRSLSALIERTPGVRQLDSWGRPS